MRRSLQTVFITIFCVVSSYEDSCTITNNGDIGASDLEAHHGQREAACCTICENTVGCSGFAWNKSENGTCLLKVGREFQTNGINGTNYGKDEGRSLVSNLIQKLFPQKPGTNTSESTNTNTSARASTRANYVDVAVQEHNRCRSRHNSPEVTASFDLNKYAQNWANHLASTDKFYHSKGPYGENLYMQKGSNTDKSMLIAKAIASFYNEIKFYDWNKPGFSSKTGHFTQVVWKSSIEIGVGIATYPDSTYKYRTTVCISYRPPGNYQGQFVDNVLPPRTKNLDYPLLNEEKAEEKPFKIMVL